MVARRNEDRLRVERSSSARVGVRHLRDECGWQRHQAAHVSPDVIQCSEGASANDLNPDWSPDGRMIVFERDFSTDDEGGYDCGLDGYGYIPSVYIMNVDGTGARRLRPVGLQNTDAEPAWSPDGLSVAFSKEEGGVYVIGADGSSGQQQLVTNYPEFSPAWSPDGKNLLFLAAAPPTNFLGIYELASGSTRLLAFSAAIGKVFQPAWSR